MFVDIVTCKRTEYDAIDAATGLYSNPPEDLLASIAWDADDPAEVTVLHVWRTPDARGQFGADQIMPLIEAGKVEAQPRRLKPFRVFLRGHSP